MAGHHHQRLINHLIRIPTTHEGGQERPILSRVTQAIESQEETMSKLVTALATATILIAGGGMIWRAEAATMTHAGSLAPLTKSYTPAEKVAYWRRQYRRAYRRGYYGYGYGYPYYGYAYPTYPYYGYAYRPYGYYGYGWRPGITIGVGPRWGWGY